MSKKIEDLVKENKEAYNRWLSNKSCESYGVHKEKKAGETKISFRGQTVEKSILSGRMIRGFQSSWVWRFLRRLKSNENEAEVNSIPLVAWTLHYTRFLNKDRPQFMVGMQVIAEDANNGDINKEEVEAAVSTLRNGRCGGTWR